MFLTKKVGDFIKKESESLEITGLEIPRDYKYDKEALEQRIEKAIEVKEEAERIRKAREEAIRNEQERMRLAESELRQSEKLAQHEAESELRDIKEANTKILAKAGCRNEDELRCYQDAYQQKKKQCDILAQRNQSIKKECAVLKESYINHFSV